MNDDADAPRFKIVPEHDPTTVEEARATSQATGAAVVEQMDWTLLPADERDDVIPTGSDGPALRIRVLRPALDPTGTPRVVDESAMPTVVYFHGGGWVVGDLDTHLGHSRRICSLVHAVVVSVDYRLAPEHPFPAAFDDAVRATEWVAQRLADFGGDDRLVVAGDGAGAQLAASVAIARRDAGQPLAAQLLLYPITDVAGRYTDEQVNAGYMSRWSAYKRFGLTLEGMVAFAETYVSDADSADWRVSPKRAATLAGVAPAVIHTSTLEVLRTEGNFFADDLRAAGVDVISREHPSLNHAYLGRGGVSAVADAATAEAAADLHEILRRASS